MYYLFGLEKNLDTIAVLSKSFIEQDSKLTTFKDLKKAYFSFIKLVQGNDFGLYLEENVFFVKEDAILDQLICLFTDNKSRISGHNFKKIDDVILLESKFQLIQKSLIRLKESHLGYYFFLELLFSCVFLIHSDAVTCATNPNAMGLLLMNHKIWDIEDICEMFVHETAHQLITLDEFRYEYYPDKQELNKHENYALSAIRKTKRPIDKVIHSLIVAFEVLMYRVSQNKARYSTKVHPENCILKSQISESIASILKEVHLVELLMPRVKLILEIIAERIQTI